MPRKLFTSPASQFLTGDNARSLNWIFRALNEYFRTHIGFWGDATGTTDANGRVTITHDCGFDPAAALVTEIYVDTTAHDMGPFHLHDYNSSTLDLHFLTKSGQDRATHNIRVCYQLLPKTK